MNVVIIETFAILALVVGSFAWSHFFFWCLERYAKSELKRQGRIRGA